MKQMISNSRIHKKEACELNFIEMEWKFYLMRYILLIYNVFLYDILDRALLNSKPYCKFIKINLNIFGDK